MAQLFRPGADSVAVCVIVALLVAPIGATVLAYMVWDSPYATDQNLPRYQPVPFSHAHHVGDLGLDCRMCHTGVEKAASQKMARAYDAQLGLGPPDADDAPAISAAGLLLPV